MIKLREKKLSDLKKKTFFNHVNQSLMVVNKRHSIFFSNFEIGPLKL